MSVIGSLLALVVFPLKVRPPEPKPDSPAPSAEAFALDFWRKAGTALMTENERLRLECKQLRDERDTIARELNRTLRLLQDQRTDNALARSQAMLAQQAQQGQQALQALQALQLAQYNQGIGGQLGMQNAYSEWCNCVPSRAQAFERRG